MAAIASIAVPNNGAFAAAATTLSASDTITFDPKKVQLLVLRNPTGGSLTATLDGADGTTVNVPGLGAVNVASGYGIAVAAGATMAVKLSSIAAYLQGVVTITGASGLVVQLFDF